MKLLFCALLAAFFACLARAIPVGRGDVSVSASAIGTYDSNITGNRDGAEDFYGTLTPQVGYTRRAGNIEADASAGLAFVRFVEQTQSDAENVQVSAALRLSNLSFQKLSAALRASYTETSDVNSDVNARLNSATTNFTGESGLLVGPRMKLNVHGGYVESSHSGASDSTIITAGADYDYRDFFYDNTLHATYSFQSAQTSGENVRLVALDQTSHLVSLGLGRPLYRDVYGRVGTGYRFLDRSTRETSIGQSQQSGLVLTAGIDGPFLPRKYFPKVRSHANFSYEDAATPGLDDSGSKQLGADIGVVWEAGPTSTVSLLVNRRQRLAVTDFSVLSTGVRLQLLQKLRYNLTGSLAAAHHWESFRGLAREDRRRLLLGDLTYRFAGHWHAGASYQFESVRSSARSSAYDRHLVMLTLGWQL